MRQPPCPHAHAGKRGGNQRGTHIQESKRRRGTGRTRAPEHAYSGNTNGSPHGAGCSTACVR